MIRTASLIALSALLTLPASAATPQSAAQSAASLSVTQPMTSVIDSADGCPTPPGCGDRKPKPKTPPPPPPPKK